MHGNLQSPNMHSIFTYIIPKYYTCSNSILQSDKIYSTTSIHCYYQVAKSNCKVGAQKLFNNMHIKPSEFAAHLEYTEIPLSSTVTLPYTAKLLHENIYIWRYLVFGNILKTPKNKSSAREETRILRQMDLNFWIPPPFFYSHFSHLASQRECSIPHKSTRQIFLHTLT